MIITLILEILLVFCAYLLGSASSAILLCRLAYDVDIRNLGSKNAGANNVQRMFGWKMGVLIFVIDFLKGMAAVYLVYLTPLVQGSEIFVLYQIILGIAALLGHIFPIFFKFHGGKGVSLLTGILAAIHPLATLVCVGVFLIVIVFSRYMSLAVLIAITCYPIIINSVFALWLIPEETLSLRIFSVLMAVTLWLTHIPNIKRLLSRQEDKFSIKGVVPTSYRNFR